MRLEDGAQTPVRANPARRKKRRWYLNRKEKITLISLGSVAAILVIVAIIFLINPPSSAQDDGLILKGVYAAGVNLGGMTPEEATDALEEATADTYTKLDMTVTVLDSQVTLPPSKTGARLDIAAVVEAAYNYGRTGSRSEREQAKKDAQINSVNIPITPYLNLNTAYIRNEIDKLGSQFSSTLTQPTVTLTGTKPPMDVPKPDTSVTHQTLHIYVGTAEYGLDPDKLYEQVLEYYNINIFQVIGACSVVAPDSLEEELMTIYLENCKEPVDAQIDPVTYEVTPEIYGYGFNLDQLKEKIANTPYGTTLNIPLCYITPNLTEDLISGNLFKDTMGDSTSALGIDEAWNNNVLQACNKLNGVIIKSGDTFSFNQLLGELTAEAGYLEALTYIGRNQVLTMGGGVTHVASVLYTCVLEAELQVLEHHAHTYAPTFIEIGRDAYVHNGTADFSFRNSRSEPIRITATVENNIIRIAITGTDDRTYQVRLDDISTPIQPGTLYNNMLPDNPGGHTDGEQLVAPMLGYTVELYRYNYDKQTGLLQNHFLAGIITYEPRDKVVVNIVSPTE